VTRTRQNEELCPHTRFQLELWELDDEQWRKVVERVARPRVQSTRQQATFEQLSFQIAGLLLLVLITTPALANQT